MARVAESVCRPSTSVLQVALHVPFPDWNQALERPLLIQEGKGRARGRQNKQAAGTPLLILGAALAAPERPCPDCHRGDGPLVTAALIWGVGYSSRV